MFKANFVKYVFDSRSPDPNARFAVLAREAAIPFAPVPGQEILWPFQRSHKIIASTWDVDRQCFMCRVEDEFAVNFDLDAPDFEETVAEAPEKGWQVVEVYPASPLGINSALGNTDA